MSREYSDTDSQQSERRKCGLCHVSTNNVGILQIAQSCLGHLNSHSLLRDQLTVHFVFR